MASRKRSAARPQPAAVARATPPPAVAPAAPAGRTALRIFFALFVLYACNARMLAPGDSIPTRRLPFSLLREGNLNLDEFSWEMSPKGRLPYYVHPANGHVYSVSTFATAVVIAPLYVLPAWWLARAGVPYDDVRARVVEVVMEHVSAAMLAALSAALLFLLLARLTTRGWALALTLLYALGTSTWSIASQALWPHALSELTLVGLCLGLLARTPTRAQLVGAGLIAALMVANRPQMLAFAALATGFVAVHHRRHLLAFVALPTLLGVGLAAYNRAIFASLTGGYGGLGVLRGAPGQGLAGMLFSPNRGLLVYTPIMAFALWGGVRLWRVAGVPPWLRWLSVGVLAHVLVHASFRAWWGGYTYGPRYFTDVLPALTIFLVYGLVPYCRQRAVFALAVALAMWGIGVQAIGVYAADDSWNRTPQTLGRSLQRLWDWNDLQIARAARDGFRGGELAAVMLDAFTDSQAARLVPLEPTDLASTIDVPDLPETVPAGSRMRLTARIVNGGAQAWPAFNGEGVISARNLVYLMVRWFDGERMVDGDVLPLPENLAPGEALDMALPLAAPKQPGIYTLEVRVTQALDGRRGVIGPDALRREIRIE
ncbi:MAG: hypothetical protein SF182_04935 [Deltaproteobacteria bacterium]|nr:hypothetical protein [Deltaproteobacteria bacterium]